MVYVARIGRLLYIHFHASTQRTSTLLLCNEIGSQLMAQSRHEGKRRSNKEEDRRLYQH